MESVKCRECGKDVSSKATICPACGVMYPANPKWKGWGFEKKSERMVGALPLLHIAFGVDENGRVRKANGFIAIGQFAKGYFVLAQFGFAYILGIGQFILAPFALSQFAFGLLSIGQLAFGIISVGQFAIGYYALCQMGFAYNLWSMKHADPSAVSFFKPFVDSLKNLF